MATIQLRHSVANDPKGAVLVVSGDRAKRLIQTGYAMLISDDDHADVITGRGKKKSRPTSPEDV